MIKFIFSTLSFFIFSIPALAQWQKQKIDTDASFRGVSAVNANVAWVSGTKGTVGRTIDGGAHWEVIHVPDAQQSDFRDIEAFSADVAYILCIGKGDASRIYKTIDGGKNWKLQFKNSNAEAFFDAFAFWDEKHGIAMSDPVDGRFVLITTDDGGASWKPIAPEKIPPAIKGEGGFAASGTCLVTRGKNDVWLASGGGASRVYHSGDRGKTWTVAETPILSGVESGGIFGIGFRDSKNGVVVGGDYREPNKSGKTAAITADGGKTWKLIENQLPFRSGVGFIDSSIIVVGTSGADISNDNGQSWVNLNKENYNAVSFFGATGWAVGPKGNIAKFVK